ncbi:MAG: tetratricopeptide repeat protein [Actinomycetota bacterium]
MEQDRPDEACRQLREQLAREQSNPRLLAMLGVALTRMGELEEAVDTLDRAHYLEPDSAEILVDYGIALLQAGRQQSARSRFEAALRLDPSNALAMRSLGELYQRMASQRGAAPASPAPQPAPPPTATPPVRSATPGLTSQISGDHPRVGSSLERTARIPTVFNEPPEESPNARRWDPEPLPSFLSLIHATLQLWGQQPLVWLLALGTPSAIAAFFVPSEPHARWAAVLAWAGALGLGAGLTLQLMSNQWIFGRVMGGPRHRWSGGLLHGTAMGLIYSLLILGPFAVALALRSPLPAPAILLGVLLMTAPFHALLAPALMLSATDGPRGWPALRRAWSIAGRRSWLHLGLIVAVGAVFGGALTAIGWGFAVTLRGQGEAVARVMDVAGLALGQSLWAALVTVTGLDALSAAEAAEAPTD